MFPTHVGPTGPENPVEGLFSAVSGDSPMSQNKQFDLLLRFPSAEGPWDSIRVAPTVSVEFPVNLLSFDGGGVKGLFSLRALILAIQGLMGDPAYAKERWIEDAREFVSRATDKTSTKQGYKTRWLIWAQQMDSMGIVPQDRRIRRWLDYPHDDSLPMQLVEIDMFFEYYVSCVHSLSGTSTGGLIVGGIAAGMTLTQLAAMYMDPKTCKKIFRVSWNPLRWNGVLQAKYTQVGVKKLIDDIFRCFAPCDDDGTPTVSKFLDFAETHDKRIHSLLQGSRLESCEKRMILSLRCALKASGVTRESEATSKAEQMFHEYQERLWEASDSHLSIPRLCRYRSKWLNSSYPHDNDETQILPTRFVITARCVNNAGAVFFDSHEPCPSGGKKNDMMMARKRTHLSTKNSLIVNKVDMKDVLLSTSAAPYFFPPHKVGNLWFQDGGIVSNDPGLVSSSFLFRAFQSKQWGFIDTNNLIIRTRELSPALKLLRVGTGKSKISMESLPWWKAQGLGLITQLAPMFMSSDSDKTDLLTEELAATNALKSNKLNSVIPGRKSMPIPFKSVNNLLERAGQSQMDDTPNLAIDNKDAATPSTGRADMMASQRLDEKDDTEADDMDDPKADDKEYPNVDDKEDPKADDKEDPKADDKDVPKVFDKDDPTADDKDDTEADDKDDTEADNKDDTHYDVKANNKDGTEVDDKNDAEADDLPMDKVETVQAINEFFAIIDNKLLVDITICTNVLLESEKKLIELSQCNSLRPEDPRKHAVDLVNAIWETRAFLSNSMPKIPFQ